MPEASDPSHYEDSGGGSIERLASGEVGFGQLVERTPRGVGPTIRLFFGTRKIYQGFSSGMEMTTPDPPWEVSRDVSGKHSPAPPGGGLKGCAGERGRG